MWKIGERMIVYIDIILAINMVMNTAILYVTAKILKVNICILRIFAGALIGSLYSFVLLLPPLSFLMSFLAKLLLSLLIVFVTFNPTNLRIFLKTTGCFYLVSFFAGGTAFGLLNLIHNVGYIGNGVYGYASTRIMFILLICAVMLFFLGRKSWNILQKMKWERIYSIPLKVLVEDKCVEFLAVLDTGNKLKDPITKEPVIIVEYKVLQKLLPFELCSQIEKEKNLESFEFLQELPLNWATRFRIIPYSSIQNQNGILLGIRPDAVFIRENKTEQKISRAILGIVFKNLSIDGFGNGLLNPEILQILGNKKEGLTNDFT